MPTRLEKYNQIQLFASLTLHFHPPPPIIVFRAVLRGVPGNEATTRLPYRLGQGPSIKSEGRIRLILASQGITRMVPQR